MEQEFRIEAPLERVWTALIDLEQVAPCLPGAAIEGSDGEGVYHGSFTIKLGPTTAAYRGEVRIESTDESTHTAVLKAKGSDKRGQGGASATIVNRLTEDGGATVVHADTDFTITGRLARFGRGGMIQDVSNRLLRDFAACLQQKLAAPVEAAAPAEPPAEAKAPGEMPPSAPPPSAAPPRPVAAAAPVKGLSLVFSVLWERIRRLFRRGR
jgi:carbon monoxide dehydrogenase subunit G